ncbi:amidohydrolase family protein, partial [Deinococcus pimensis]|uniref:amidohydrolase family protein n=1 Tax=Deinococcus pimensis TaxID=309888 RepID=UPI0012FA2C77
MVTRIVNVKRVGSTEPESLFVEGGVVLGWNLDRDAGRTLDGRGGTVVPALIELHAHLREPGQEEKEDLASGLAAAAAGGYGTVVSMPNTSPVVDDPAIVEALLRKANALGLARLRPAA